ncbi:MAG: hypothetical protein KJS74_09935, partial [Rhodospirillales bacterium]|nr:hypothetical protein [Rhodospirillales bacterium]
MEQPQPTTRVSVLLPYKFGMAFTYEAEAPLVPGTLVRVPLGRRAVVGVVWDDPPDMDIKARPVT